MAAITSMQLIPTVNTFISLKAIELDEDTETALTAICDNYFAKSIFETKSFYVQLKDALETRLYQLFNVTISNKIIFTMC